MSGTDEENGHGCCINVLCFFVNDCISVNVSVYVCVCACVCVCLCLCVCARAAVHTLHTVCKFVTMMTAN